ncbi:sugar ABC transporter permease [Chloroflexi bacterium TSY]|nr:sugar ABC transporter permease [Chloroflexi bacterium TSY]
MREIKYGLLFVSPAILFFSIFYVYPLARAVYISFHKWSLLTPPEFNGVRNYQRLFQDPEFLNSLWVTAVYVFWTVLFIWIFALGLALIFNNQFRLRQGYLTLYYLPAVVSLTVWSLIWRLMYHPTGGILTIFTQPLGFDHIRWLNDANLAMPAIIILSIWKGTPFYMIIYLAGLRSIPSDYYEAAMVDGATWLQRLWSITLPLLKPVMLYVAVISIIIGFQVFTPVFLLTGGGPGSATRAIPMFIVDNAFKFSRMGYASASSLILFLILMGVTLIQFRFLGQDPSA